jgi:hypothetical protein
VDRERRLGLLVIVAALATIALMLGPLGEVPGMEQPAPEVLDETLER